MVEDTRNMPLSPKRIMEERMKTFRNNLDTFSISFSGILTDKILKTVEKLVPGLSYDRIISPEILGIISIISRLDSLRSIHGFQIPDKTNKLIINTRASISPGRNLKR